MPTWPATLPCRPIAGWSARQQDNKAAVSPEIGPEIVRRRGTAAGSERQFQWFMTRAQLADFEAFYKVDCADGSLVFDLKDPLDKVVRAFRFVGSYEYREVANGRYLLSTVMLRVP